MVQSIDEQLNTITQDVADTYTALGAKGATLPAFGSRGTKNLASTVATVPSSDPVNKVFDVVDGVVSKHAVTFNENSFDGVTSISNYGLQSAYYSGQEGKSNPGGVIKFNSLTSVGVFGLYEAFKYCNITSVSFNSLTEINKQYALSNAFAYNAKLVSASFPSLTSIAGQFSFQYVFDDCDSLTSVSFPNLETVNGYCCFRFCFQSCDSLASVSFPSLTSIAGDNATNYMFNRCYRLSSVDFSSLETIGDSTATYMFYSCGSLTTVSFPALTTVGSSSLSGCFYGCKALKTISFPALTTVKSNSFGSSAFSGCTALTEIHFRADMQATVEALSGYSSKWGATNATIYFDL